MTKNFKRMLFWAVLCLTVASNTSCKSSTNQCLASDVAVEKAYVSSDGKVWMNVDTVNLALVAYSEESGCVRADTLAHYDPSLGVLPLEINPVATDEGDTLYLFLYSFGRLLCCDEAMACKVDRNGITPVPLFVVDGHSDSTVGCLWFDQLVDASKGFPFDDPDQGRFGIHYDPGTRQLYVPVMEHHEEGSEFEDCLLYTGRFRILGFDGRRFVPAGTDGAWWLHASMRGYRRTLDCHRTVEGYEQTDLMYDGSLRRAVWNNAQSHDDLGKEPDTVERLAGSGR